jgi:hypothetical protein
MTPAALEAPPARSAGWQAARRVGGRGVTLEERLESAWRAAQREGVAECLVCHGQMLAAGAGARCEGCGSVIS